MWIKLKSYKEGSTLLVSLDQVTHITARQAGGSTLYFAMESSDIQGHQPKQRLLPVQDSVDEIASKLELAPSARRKAA